MDRDSRVFVTGHTGLVGSAVVRRLRAGGFHRLLLRTHHELDLRRQAVVESFMCIERPDVVIMAAGTVGGILANSTRGGEFIYDNIAIAANVLETSRLYGVGRVLFLGSSCIYPRMAPQPIAEDSLLAGPLEPTNRPYAVAKIAGVEMVRAYRKQYGCRWISAMPTNLYGPGDNFDPTSSHVLPALMWRIHEAKLRGAPEVIVWGTGRPRREFMHVDDLADACVFLLDRYDGEDPINVGVGEDMSIYELAQLVGRVIGYKGAISFDVSKPDGTPRKLLDVRRLTELGWRAKITLERGLGELYAKMAPQWKV